MDFGFISLFVIHKALSSLEFGLKKQCPLPLVQVAHNIVQTLESSILPSYITPFYLYLFCNRIVLELIRIQDWEVEILRLNFLNFWRFFWLVVHPKSAHLQNLHLDFYFWGSTNLKLEMVLGIDELESSKEGGLQHYLAQIPKPRHLLFLLRWMWITWTYFCYFVPSCN